MNINLEEDEIVYIGVCTTCGIPTNLEIDNDYCNSEMYLEYLFCQVCAGNCFIKCGCGIACNCIEVAQQRIIMTHVSS